MHFGYDGNELPHGSDFVPGIVGLHIVFIRNVEVFRVVGLP